MDYRSPQWHSKCIKQFYTKHISAQRLGNVSLKHRLYERVHPQDTYVNHDETALEKKKKSSKSTNHSPLQQNTVTQRHV